MMLVEDMQMTEKEYRARPEMSASGFKEFYDNKRKFYEERIAKTKSREDPNAGMVVGSIVHTYLLEPEEFDDTYHTAQCTEPPTAMMFDFTVALFKHTMANTDEDGVQQALFSDLVEKARTDSGFKISSEAILKKWKDSQAEVYYNDLRDGQGRGMKTITLADVNIAKKIVRIAEADEFTGWIFQGEDFNEQKVVGFEIDGLPMRSMLDKIKVDHENKVLQIYDLKVCYDNQEFYRTYYLKRAAYLQGYIYWRALKSGMLDLGFDYSDYKIPYPIFVVLDQGCFFAPLQYHMTDEDMDDAYFGFTYNGRYYPGLQELIADYKFCMDNDIWNTSRINHSNAGIVYIKEKKAA